MNFEDRKESEVLKPVAVIPLKESNSHEISYLESFATSSNSQMVYACNENGEKVAVGIIVTESFYGSSENSAEAEVICEPNAAWIAAEEECVTEDLKSKDLKQEIANEVDKEKVVHVYKVNKGKRKEEVRKKRTLKQIKKNIEHSKAKKKKVDCVRKYSRSAISEKTCK